MNKSESKYFNTARIMDQAIMELLSTKEIQYITVKEICAKAGVNRSTFYLHYETIDDLLKEAMEYIETRYSDIFKGKTSRSIKDDIDEAKIEDLLLVSDEFLIPYLKFVLENRVIYKAYARNQVSTQASKRFNWLIDNVLEPILNRFDIAKEDQRYWAVFTINGIWSIIQEWINNDCKDSVEHVAEVIEKCMHPGIKKEKPVNKDNI